MIDPNYIGDIATIIIEHAGETAIRQIEFMQELYNNIVGMFIVTWVLLVGVIFVSIERKKNRKDRL